MIQVVMPILTAALPYASLGGSVVFVLALLYVSSHRAKKFRNLVSECEASIQSEAAQLTNAVNELKRRMSDLETEEEPQPNGVAGGNGLNSSVRSKVLKMHRLGQSTDRISDTLGVPKGEVDLLVKVHRIVMRPYESAAAGQEPILAKKG